MSGHYLNLFLISIHRWLIVCVFQQTLLPASSHATFIWHTNGYDDVYVHMSIQNSSVAWRKEAAAALHGDQVTWCCGHDLHYRPRPGPPQTFWFFWFGYRLQELAYCTRCSFGCFFEEMKLVDPNSPVNVFPFANDFQGVDLGVDPSAEHPGRVHGAQKATGAPCAFWPERFQKSVTHYRHE